MLYLPYAFIFYALDKATLRFYLECTKIIIGLALLLVFIPLFGLIGAAWAITITMAANAGWSYLILRQKIARHFAAQVVA
jgi:O-antigen/teichoic acid export membrane protein